VGDWPSSAPSRLAAPCRAAAFSRAGFGVDVRVHQLAGQHAHLVLAAAHRRDEHGPGRVARQVQAGFRLDHRAAQLDPALLHPLADPLRRFQLLRHAGADEGGSDLVGDLGRLDRVVGLPGDREHMALAFPAALQALQEAVEQAGGRLARKRLDRHVDRLPIPRRQEAGEPGDPAAQAAGPGLQLRRQIQALDHLARHRPGRDLADLAVERAALGRRHHLLQPVRAARGDRLIDHLGPGDIDRLDHLRGERGAAHAQQQAGGDQLPVAPHHPELVANPRLLAGAPQRLASILRHARPRPVRHDRRQHRRDERIFNL
jgi:hypothetical protein